MFLEFWVTQRIPPPIPVWPVGLPPVLRAARSAQPLIPVQSGCIHVIPPVLWDVILLTFAAHTHPPNTQTSTTSLPSSNYSLLGSERNLLFLVTHFPLWRLKDRLKVSYYCGRYSEEDKERKEGGWGCCLAPSSRKSLRCCGEMRLQQLCVYVCRLDDIRSHMRTQFATLTLQSITIKYGETHTHTHWLTLYLSLFCSLLLFSSPYLTLTTYSTAYSLSFPASPFLLLSPSIPSLPFCHISPRLTALWSKRPSNLSPCVGLSAPSLTHWSLHTLIRRTGGHTWERNVANSLWMETRGPYAECFQTWESVLTRAQACTHRQMSSSRSNLSVHSRTCLSWRKVEIKVMARCSGCDGKNL